MRKTSCDKYFTACFHAEIRIFQTSILRTDLKCYIYKAHIMATVFSVGVGYFFVSLYACFCIALLYKMCLERVVNIELKEHDWSYYCTVKLLK